MKQIYLDYAAATPMDKAAIVAVEPFLADNFYNPSAIYQAGREARHALEAARQQVAAVLGAKDQEIIFMAGSSEANNTAIQGVMRLFPNAEIITSNIEHESVLRPAEEYRHTILPVDHTGRVEVKKLVPLITDQTVLLSVMYANNEVGTIQPIKELSNIIKKIRMDREKRSVKLPLYLHSDAAQAANYLDVSVSRLGVDLMSLNGGKIYGPKQSGCLFVKSGVNLKPLISGGGQEGNRRSGTENMAASIAFATMLQKVQAERKTESKRLAQVRDEFFATISQNVTDLQRNGNIKHALANNLNITIFGADGERLVMELDQAGILAATGSACTAGSDEPSHVLLAMGATKAEASGSLRFSFGRLTTTKQAAQAAAVVSKVIQQHQRLV